MLDKKHSESAKAAVLSLCELFKGKALDVTHKSLTLELCAKKTRVDAFVALVQKYGQLEVVRSGSMAIPRAPVEGIDTEPKQKTETPMVDATTLPPG
jgi:acetolactate synthase I/III small subunit